MLICCANSADADVLYFSFWSSTANRLRLYPSKLSAEAFFDFENYRSLLLKEAISIRGAIDCLREKRKRKKKQAEAAPLESVISGGKKTKKNLDAWGTRGALWSRIHSGTGEEINK